MLLHCCCPLQVGPVEAGKDEYAQSGVCDGGSDLLHGALVPGPNGLGPLGQHRALSISSVTTLVTVACMPAPQVAAASPLGSYRLCATVQCCSVALALAVAHQSVAATWYVAG